LAARRAAIRRLADEIARIQKTYGNDAFGLLTGASLMTEKCHLMGKFARMCLKTANIDYNATATGPPLSRGADRSH
jgi:assimilatory nitrate reductase catalytic subunit